MTKPAPTLALGLTFADAIAQLRGSGPGIYAVVDTEGKLQGACTVDDLIAAVYALKPPNTPLAEIMSHPAPIMAESKPLGETMRAFVLQEPIRPFIVVADDDATRPVGVLTPFDAVSRYAALIGPQAP